MLLLAAAASAQAAEQLGRATYYGKDEFSLNDGTCACHKQGLWSSNPCSNNFCFDWIGEKHDQSSAQDRRTLTEGPIEPHRWPLLQEKSRERAMA